MVRAVNGAPLNGPNTKKKNTTINNEMMCVIIIIKTSYSMVTQPRKIFKCNTLSHELKTQSRSTIIVQRSTK